jgi:SAM-dependent methyltransferase
VGKDWEMPTVYDEVPYENLPFTQALPSGHATIAALHGLRPPDPRTARVLELGCGAGAHLAGVAAANPEVRAVGVDLAASAIEVARETAAAAGLGNVRFDVADVLELSDGRLGEFEYVIVHGLYAWASEPLREAVLEACRAHLAPDGIVYVSYNSHPGGHLRRMLREMAQWHARGVADPREEAERARSLFNLLDRFGETGGPTFYAGVLGEEVRALANAPEALLVHDLLSSAYSPVWFVDFATAAERHGLAYVADAIPGASREAPWSDAVEAFVADGAGDDRIAREQYFDLLVLRRFRHSLLCHADQAPAPRVDPAAVQEMLVSADDLGTAPEPLRALLEGVERPVPFAALQERAGMPARELADALLGAFDVGAAAFHLVPSPAAAEPGPRPRASSLARSQARPGALVTTLNNQLVRISDEPTCQLLSLLDGTRDRAAILGAFGAGPLDEAALEGALAKFAELGLLHEECLPPGRRQLASGCRPDAGMG